MASSLVNRVARSLIGPLGYDPKVDWERMFVGGYGHDDCSLADLCRSLAIAAIETGRQPGTRPEDMAPHEEVECALALFRALKLTPGEFMAVKVEPPALWQITKPRDQEAIKAALITVAAQPQSGDQ